MLNSKFLSQIENQLRIIPNKDGQFQWHPLFDLKDYSFSFEVKEKSSFMTTENVSENCFLWYKNLNLPNIQVKIKFKGAAMQLSNLKAAIISLKKESGSQRLVQSQMRGKWKLGFMNDEVEFKQIKFSETSYKNGVKKKTTYTSLLLPELSSEGTEKPRLPPKRAGK